MLVTHGDKSHYGFFKKVYLFIDRIGSSLLHAGFL